MIGVKQGSHAKMNTVTLACLQIQPPGHPYEKAARYIHERIGCKTTF